MSENRPEIKVEYVSTETILPYANNARNHGDADVDAIMASIREFGFNDPIAVWKNIIVEGHGRLLAAKRLGMETVPVIRLDHLTDEQRKAYALAHNKTAELSGWNFDVLDAELKDLADFDMAQFGFEEAEETEDPDDLQEDEYDPETAAGHDVQRGMVFVCGNHRVMCGDATSKDDADRLMGGGEGGHRLHGSPVWSGDRDKEQTD